MKQKNSYDIVPYSINIEGNKFEMGNLLALKMEGRWTLVAADELSAIVAGVTGVPVVTSSRSFEVSVSFFFPLLT